MHFTYSHFLQTLVTPLQGNAVCFWRMKRGEKYTFYIQTEPVGLRPKAVHCQCLDTVNVDKFGTTWRWNSFLSVVLTLTSFELLLACGNCPCRPSFLLPILLDVSFCSNKKKKNGTKKFEIQRQLHRCYGTKPAKMANGMKIFEFHHQF